MGMTVRVGQEPGQGLVEYLALVNEQLVAAGLPEHSEPMQLGEDKRFSAQFSTAQENQIDTRGAGVAETFPPCAAPRCAPSF